MPDTKEKEVKSTEGASTTKKTKNKKNTPIITLVIVFVIIIIIAVAYFAGIFDKQEEGELANETTTEEPQTNNAVAKVDDVEIFESEVNARAEALVANYQFPTTDGSGDRLSEAKGVALQQLVNEVLILNAAYDQEIFVSDQDIQNEFDRVRASFPDDETFWSTLEKNNINEDALKIDMGRQLTIQRYIDDNTDADNIAVTEEEMEDLYDQYASQQDNMPAFEEISAQLEDQLFQQKLNAQIDELIRVLDQAASVEIYS